MKLDRACQIVALGLLPIIGLPPVGLSFALLCCLLVLLWALWRRAWLWVCVATLIGYGYVDVLQTAQFAQQMKPSKSHEPIKIVRLLKQQHYQTAIAERVDGSRLYLNWQSDTPLLLARHYQADLTLKPISGRLNHGNFDRQRWLFAQHLTAIATVKHAELLPKTVFDWRAEWLYRAKAQTAELPTQGLLLALAFGERAWLPEQHWQAFQQTTTAHLIAISGLHIALAFGFGVAFARVGQWWAFRFKYQWLTSYYLPQLVGFLFALGYSFLAGFSLPTVRAFIAISVVLACRFGRRHYSTWQLWWRVVALLVVLDPLALLSDSFWLSILAVASLIFWYQYFPFARFQRADKSQPHSHYGKLWVKLPRLLGRLIHLQLGIWLIFTPVQLFFFGGSSPWALFANLLIVPLYSFVLVPLILISLLSDNGFATWQLADWIAEQSVAFLTHFADGWWALNYTQQGGLLCVNFVVMALLYLWLNRHEMRIGWRAAALLTTVCLIFPLLLRINTITPHWLMFDVGQGLSMALIYPENGKTKAILYDTGASWDGGSMAKLELLPYLKRHGIEPVALFVSHNDNDHAGGVTDFLTAYPETRLIASGQLPYANRQPEACDQGKSWQWQAVRVHALSPQQTVPKAKNVHSCVLLVEVAGRKLLWTGDSGRQQEQQFAREVGKIDFLQVGHHGSKSSTSETLLAHTLPDVALISSGLWNPWQLPNKAVMARLARQQIAVWNTAQSGMIRVDFSPNGDRITTARHRYSPWFNRLP